MIKITPASTRYTESDPLPLLIRFPYDDVIPAFRAP
jgi:hypothetical protein